MIENNLIRKSIYFTLAYIATNALFIFRPFIPSLGTWLAWGFILPIMVVGFAWVFAYKRRQVASRWWVYGLVATTMYGTLGFLSLYVIGAMWASV